LSEVGALGLDLWIFGSLDLWIFGSLDLWIFGSLDLWIFGSLDLWILDCFGFLAAVAFAASIKKFVCFSGQTVTDSQTVTQGRR
jgi:hypothetical protein